jgi:hypothetical protein
VIWLRGCWSYIAWDKLNVSKNSLLGRNYEKRIMSRLDQKSGKNGFLVCAEDNILEIIELMAENKDNINLQGEDRNTAPPSQEQPSEV